MSEILSKYTLITLVQSGSIMIPFGPMDRDSISPYFVFKDEINEAKIAQFEGYFFKLSTVLGILKLQIYDDNGSCIKELSMHYEIVDDKTGVVWDFSSNIIRRFE